LFTDHKEEGMRILDVIEDRRRRKKSELVVQVLQQDTFGECNFVKGTV